jgi:predicted nucleotidyltransferase
MIKQKEQIIGILNVMYPGIKIILLGSRARGDFKENSDVDLALDIGRKIKVEELAQIQNLIEALNVPQMVDVIDMHRIPADMKDIILKEGIVWKD